MNVKGNQQYQETHNRILNCVLRLLENKELRQITVSEICRSILINRSTFYEHFLDIYDVIDKTEQEYVQQISELISGGLLTSRKDTVLLVLGFIREHKEFYSRIMSLGRQLHIPEELLNEDLTDRRNQIASGLWGNDAVMAAYQWEYMKGSFNAIIREWLHRDCTEAPEQIWDILSRLSNVSAELH